MKNKEHQGRGNCPGSRGKVEEGELLPGAEDEESRPGGRGTLQRGWGKAEDGEPLSEPLPEPKMRNQDYRAGNLPEGRGKVDEEPLSGPKRRNQDRAAVGGNLPGGQGKTEEGMPLPGADSIMGSRAQFF